MFSELLPVGQYEYYECAAVKRVDRSTMHVHSAKRRVTLFRAFVAPTTVRARRYRVRYIPRSNNIYVRSDRPRRRLQKSFLRHSANRWRHRRRYEFAWCQTISGRHAVRVLCVNVNAHNVNKHVEDRCTSLIVFIGHSCPCLRTNGLHGTDTSSDQLVNRIRPVNKNDCGKTRSIVNRLRDALILQRRLFCASWLFVNIFLVKKVSNKNKLSTVEPSFNEPNGSLKKIRLTEIAFFLT